MSSKASRICRWPSLTCALSLLVTSGSLYTPAEDTYLALCVQQSFSITEAARRFSQRVRRFALRPSLLSFLADLFFFLSFQHPHRTTTSVINHYSGDPAKFGDCGRHTAFFAGKEPRTDLWTSIEDQQLVELIATRSEGAITSALQRFVQKVSFSR